MGIEGHGDVEMWGYGDVRTQEYGDMGCRDIGASWGRGDVEIRRPRDVGTWGHQDMEVRGHGDVGTSWGRGVYGDIEMWGHHGDMGL